MAQTLKSLSTPYRETNDEQYYQDFARTLTPYLDPPPGQKVEVVAKVLPLGLDILQEAGYRFDSQLTLAMKAMAQAEAITGALVPDWTGTEFMKRSFDALMTRCRRPSPRTWSRTRSSAQAGYVAREAIEQLPMLQSGAFKWLDNLKKGGVTVELDTSGLNEQLQQLRGIAMMITLGILVVGMVVGSALAAGIGGLEGQRPRAGDRLGGRDLHRFGRRRRRRRRRAGLAAVAHEPSPQSRPPRPHLTLLFLRGWGAETAPRTTQERMGGPRVEGAAMPPPQS